MGARQVPSPSASLEVEEPGLGSSPQPLAAATAGFSLQNEEVPSPVVGVMILG